MSLQERTLVVRNFDPDKTTQKLLKELCLQAGPVRNVVIRQDHAFVEFDDVESVGFSKALLDGIKLHGRKLCLEPKLKTEGYYRYTKLLQNYIKFDKQQRALTQQESLRLQSFQQNHIINPTGAWLSDSARMNVPYPPQQLFSPQQYMIPPQQQQMTMPIAGGHTVHQNQQIHPSYLQSNGYTGHIQPTNYFSPVVSQPTVNSTYNQANNNGRQLNAFKRHTDSWSNRRR